MCWRDVPEYALLRVLALLERADVLAAGLACRRWNLVAKDSLVWRNLLVKDFGLEAAAVALPPDSEGWFYEYRRLVCDLPMRVIECANSPDPSPPKNDDFVAHACFAHDGSMFATTSSTAKLMVWSAEHPCSLKYEYNMKTWFHANNYIFSQFNYNDTMLLVCSSTHYLKDTIHGETAVFTFEHGFSLKYRLAATNHSQIFHCFIGENHLLSGEHVRIDNSTGSTNLSIKKVFEYDYRSKNCSIPPLMGCTATTRYLPELSYVKCLLVCECHWNGEEKSPDDVVRSEERIIRLSQKNGVVVRYDESEETNPSDGSNRENDIANKMIIFSILDRNYDVRKIGFKKIKNFELSPRPPLGPSIGTRDAPDKIIDVNEEILKMALSPDEKYLYVYCDSSTEVRSSEKTPQLHDSIKVIDLVKLTFAGEMASPKPSKSWKFSTMNVSNKYVVVGHDNDSFIIFDRHFGVCIKKPQNETLNLKNPKMLLNPVDAHMCITYCRNDFVKVWRSQSSTDENQEKHSAHELQATQLIRLKSMESTTGSKMAHTNRKFNEMESFFSDCGEKPSDEWLSIREWL